MTGHGSQIVWRIAKDTKDRRATDLSGQSAKVNNGRWNARGTPVVYASATIALAVLETLAHADNAAFIRNAFLVRICVPQPVWRLREIIRPSDFDPTWLAEPAGYTTLEFGDTWLASVCAPLLLVPSVIVPEEYNVLINPLHPAASRITAAISRQYTYDPRF